jgi:penicillin-binding protein 1A
MSIGGVILAVAGAFQYLNPELPDVATLRDVRLQVPLRVYSRDGKLIAQIGEQRRIPLSYEAYPKRVVDAFLASEDDRFFQHSGVDYPGLLRAVLVNLRSGEKSQGGGTITMQLARNIFLTPERSYRRKLLEIFSALRIEHEFSKKEILALYLNKIFLGQRAYGVGAAAEVYFGKTVEQLDLSEIAIIAGLPRAPSRDNPVARPDLAQQRRAYVLRRMYETGVITREEHDAAFATPIESRLHGPSIELEAPYVAEMVRVDLLARIGPQIYTDGYQAITTIDSRLQRAAIRGVRLGLLEYDGRHGYRGPAAHIQVAATSKESDWLQTLEDFPVKGGLEPALILSVSETGATAFTRRNGRINLAFSTMQWARPALPDGSMGKAPQQPADVVANGDIVYVAQEVSGNWHLLQIPDAQGAFVALDPQDGGVAALVGGFDYYSSNYNRAVQARRQPGSSFKPFLYSAALEHGFTPATLVNDAPIVFEDASLESNWRPQNVSREFYGPTRVREALVRSRNLVSIRIMHAIGPAYATDYMQHFGFSQQELPQNLSLALGTTQVSPLEMATAYAIFANGGYRVSPYYIQRVEDATGKVVFAAEPKIACATCVSGNAYDVANRETSTVRVASTAQQTSAPNAQAEMEKNERLAEQAITPQNAYVMTDMMMDVVKRGTATRALELKRGDIAGKTGTTNDRRDAWFCGFNPDLVGAAWVGFDQERSLGAREEGGRTALPIWMYFMADALKGVPERRLPTPSGLVSMRISSDTGLPARAGDANTIFETFIAGHVPESEDNPVGGTNAVPSPSKPETSEEPLF